jgi:hypothetical protein
MSTFKNDFLWNPEQIVFMLTIQNEENGGNLDEQQSLSALYLIFYNSLSYQTGNTLLHNNKLIVYQASSHTLKPDVCLLY